MLTQKEMKERARLIGKFLRGQTSKEEFTRLQELEHKARQ